MSRFLVIRIFVLSVLLSVVNPSRGDAAANEMGSASSPKSDPPAHFNKITWGIFGHPTWPDYADWVPGNASKEMAYVRLLGCTYYRCSFEGAEYPSILNKLVPPAQSAGITLLPILPIKISAKNDAPTNYLINYKIASAWASYAISKGYSLPYWELGNELENNNLVKIVYDGTSPDQFPDKTPGGFSAIASSLSGAYQGLKDAYSAGRAAGTTTIVPQVLYGCAYRHWGLLTKIQNYNGSLPCDVISWHWYEPNYGFFSSPIHDSKSFSHDRSPAECLADFKSKTDPTRSMDVWITEMNRSVHTSHGFLNGSFSDAGSGEDWSAQAREIQLIIGDLEQAPNVKGIFVYELLDEKRANKSNPSKHDENENFGLLSSLDGPFKDAFYVYQSAIKANP